MRKLKPLWRVIYNLAELMCTPKSCQKAIQVYGTAEGNRIIYDFVLENEINDFKLTPLFFEIFSGLEQSASNLEGSYGVEGDRLDGIVSHKVFQETFIKLGYNVDYDVLLNGHELYTIMY